MERGKEAKRNWPKQKNGVEEEGKFEGIVDLKNDGDNCVTNVLEKKAQ